MCHLIDEMMIEALLNEENAVLVDPLDVDLWEKALLELIENRDKRLSIATKAYDDFIAHYTWKSRAKNILNFILK